MKLKLHTKTEGHGGNPDLLVNLKYFPDAAVGDILEIYHENNECSRLLLQITKNSEDLKDPLSIEQSVASAFQINKYKEIIVTKVGLLKEVTLDLVEIIFKDQYYNRSDMWHMRSKLVGTCTYLNMSIQHTEMKANIYEMWAKGEKVTCGYISDETRIVFRSLTSVVQIFIQMSAEMWEFDNYGDLYFEKAVGGFLCDLFDKWKEKKCSHDVTIVLFSRTFFDATSFDNFPAQMRECLQQDHKGRIYEDYYRVVIQNERYDDWNPAHVKLRKMFNDYQDSVLLFHRRHGNDVPRGSNSMAAQGNFLETLNMALNLFEKSYLDRSFDRTGMVAVVITPGAGVFEVDRELCNITKQRTIDCGAGSDLVCVGEQPLHAVPLFKFHNKITSTSCHVGDDYNIPHWMNHSFYTSRSQSKCLANSSFVPRIKPPQAILDRIRNGECNDSIFCPPTEDKILRKCAEHTTKIDFIDYDDYDAQIFKPPSRIANKSGFYPQRSKSFFTTSLARQVPQSLAEAKQQRVPRDRHISDHLVDALASDKRSSSPTVKIPIVRMGNKDGIGTSSVGCYPVTDTSESLTSQESDDGFMIRPIVGSACSTVGRSKTLMCLHNFRPNRALINPFAPSRMHFKMTSNRRRWVHAFPINPKGAAVQTHHVHTSTTSESDDDVSLSNAYPTPKNAAMGKSIPHKQPGSRPDNSYVEVAEPCRSMSPIHSLSNSLRVDNSSAIDISPSSSYQNYSMLYSVPPSSSSSYTATGGVLKKMKGSGTEQTVCLWGATGEQEWSPEITTGHDWRPLDEHEVNNEPSHLVKPILSTDIHSHTFCATISVDWKSLVIPASLPITTDYFPDMTCLYNDYVQNNYSLTDDECYSNGPDASKVGAAKPSRVEQLFHEMISQRIDQGFQLVVKPRQNISQTNNLSDHPMYDHVAGLRRGRARDYPKNKFYLSIGRIFHELELTGCSISVHRYRPRHPQRQLHYNYRYRFQAPDSYMYDVSWTQFCNAQLESYNWNYLDQYLLTRGREDYGLIESLRYWRSRFLLLPCNMAAIKKILDNNSRCDVYEDQTTDESHELTAGFVRFMETLNSIQVSQSRRRSHTRKKNTPAVKSSENTAQSSTAEVKKAPSLITQTSNEIASVVITTGETNSKPSCQSKPGTNESCLVSTAPLSTIVEAMLDSNDGFSILGKHISLPPESFVSVEAVDWCVENMGDISDTSLACQFMQRLVDEGHVCHVSGNQGHPFIIGFYIYTFITAGNNTCSMSTELWEIRIPAASDQASISHDTLLDLVVGASEATSSYVSTTSGNSHASASPYKFHNLVISERPRDEWASVRYHGNYDPRCAFELRLQWLVATGCILAELVTMWAKGARKAKSKDGMNLLPVPIDPFALPHTENSDPLRGPIFVPFLYGSLLYPGSSLSTVCERDGGIETIMKLQEFILNRFGFMPIQPRDCSVKSDERNQYVHCTGGMFVLIPDMRTRRCPDPKRSRCQPQQVTLHEYISRQTSVTNPGADCDLQVGYLWSWNYMLTCRWRSSNIGHSEAFQDKMLADFRQFCSDKDGRLEEVWREFSGSGCMEMGR